MRRFLEGTFRRKLLRGCSVAAGNAMPIRKYMSGATFGPETISNMTTAFERIRKILKLEDPGDPLVEVIAKKVISLGSQGIFDPKEIERLVIADTKRP